jgi:ABC-type lipoprotein release transport system permease subunit
MRGTRLVIRGLQHYWRTNAAVVLGVAAAVTVLAGALLVGDSVRGSLRDLVLQRLGATDLVVISPSEFFRDQLGEEVRADAAFQADFADLCPIVAVQGFATEQEGGRRASGVHVYGIDGRFWRFHGVAPRAGAGGPEGRDVLLSEALARELGAAEGATVLLRVQRPSEIPLESLHGRKDEAGQTIRLTVRAILPGAELGEFSLQPQQGDVRAAFLSLARLQQDLGAEQRVNALLVSTRAEGDAEADADELKGRLESLIRRHAALEDVGLRLRVLEAQQVLALESASALIDAPREAAASAAAGDLGLGAMPVTTYLVNSIRRGERAIPYSLVTALDLESAGAGLQTRPRDDEGNDIVLNTWAARDLEAAVGDDIALDYYVWEDPGRLVARTASFRLAAIVPMAGLAADRDLAPEYPGITESDSLREWDPPFPIDLARIRPADEDYWQQYRTAPKGFISQDAGRMIWSSRYGSLTSIRLTPPANVPLVESRAQYGARLRTALDPLALGLAVRDIRRESVTASQGATDFGEYFAYFSFFLVVSALVLAALFFKLGVEQRAREVGLLRAVGFPAGAVRGLFAAEALTLSLVGSAIGAAGALGYAALMMTGLRTWWVDAVGTTALSLHLSPWSLAAGMAGGLVSAVVCVWLKRG